MIFQVENEIVDFCSDLEEYSLSKLDNVVFSLEREREREKCFENKQFSLSGEISIKSSVPPEVPVYLNKIIPYCSNIPSRVPLIRADVCCLV